MMSGNRKARNKAIKANGQHMEKLFKDQGVAFKEKEPFALPALQDGVIPNSSIQNMPIRGDLVEVEIKTLVPNQNQTRSGYKDGFFSEQAKELMQQEHIKGLADSIKINGLLQPIAIYPTKDSNVNFVVYGHQRVLAHILLGKTHIKAMVVSLVGNIEEELLIKNLTENLARTNFNPAEVASALEALSEKISFKEIEKAIGVSYTALCSLARLGALSKQVQQDLMKNHRAKRDMRLLYEISKLPQGEQWEIYKAYQDGKMTRKQVQQFVKDRLTNKQSYSHTLRFFTFSKFQHPSIRKFLDTRKDFYEGLDRWVEDYLKHNGFNFALLDTKESQKNKKKKGEKNIKDKIEDRLEEQQLAPQSSFSLNEWLAEHKEEE